MFKWFIEVDIKSTSKLSEVFSSTHEDAVITIAEDKLSSHIELSSDEIPNKDFVLIYNQENMYTPDEKLVQHSEYKDTVVASINFFPDFNQLTVE